MSVGDACSHDGCGRLQTPKSGRGLCPMHYKRELAGIDMDAPPKAPRGETLRVFTQLLNSPSTDQCIKWPLGCGANGYGMMTDETGRRLNVHVKALEITAGPRPTRQHDAIHTCRNRHCMNPRHLRWGTRSENSLDRHRDGTCVQAKLTPAQVVAIRYIADRRLMSQARLAELCGVCTDTISKIKKRSIWKHLEEAA